VITAVQREWTPYCGAAPVPDELIARWNLDPLLLIGIAIATLALWYWSRRPAMTAAALAMALFLFVSPFCALSSALFSARVTHHVLLTAVIAPLVVFAVPRESSKWPGSLPLWTGIQALTFWFWHAPPVYEAALSNTLVYWIMQFSLLATATGFWITLRRAPEPPAVASLLFSTVQMGLLGALITFADVPLFAPHYLSTLPWGYSPLEDQQLAGLIMWAPSAAVYLGAALLVASRWLSREEH
jgi:putative membrane protein